ncbi:MAG: molybdenum cofactor guanylyltransferase [Acidimicrobiales bacterium]
MADGVAGAVLAGGASRRFGSDKAVFRVEGSTMLERAVSLLSSVNCDPILVVGGRSEQRHVTGTTFVPDKYPGEGPLGGVLTALDAVVASWTMMIACDLPYLNADVLEALLTHATTADVVLARTSRGPEPLVGLYSQTVQTRFEAAFRSGTRAVSDALGLVTVDHVSVVASKQLRNVNRVEDL